MYLCVKCQSSALTVVARVGPMLTAKCDQCGHDMTMLSSPGGTTLEEFSEAAAKMADTLPKVGEALNKPQP